MAEPVDVDACLRYDAPAMPMHPRVKRATTSWRRAANENATLRDDFMWRPDVVTRHSDWPLDAATSTAEIRVNDILNARTRLDSGASNER